MNSKEAWVNYFVYRNDKMKRERELIDDIDRYFEARRSLLFHSRR